MNTIRVSATAARNNFFDLLNKVSLGVKVIVVKDTKDVAMIVPNKTKTDWKGLYKAMKAANGIAKDFDLQKSPLRNPKMIKSWGTWDQNVKKS